MIQRETTLTRYFQKYGNIDKAVFMAKIQREKSRQVKIQASLKPSYVMYIGKDKLDSMVEKENIELIKKQMKESGLEIPLVIFDRYSIREEIKNNKLK